EPIEIHIDIDKDKIGQVILFIDGEEVDWFNSPVYDYTWETASLTLGEHTYAIDINDMNGDDIIVKTLTITIIDSNAPTAPATVTDIDGNVYHTVVIGTQVWMVENLKTTRYRNGDAIPQVSGQEAWETRTTDAYCNMNNDVAIGDVYGRLYNFYAVEHASKICPEGWHVPTRDELKTLADYLGGMSIAGKKMKEAGATHWTYYNDPVNNGTNESGFTALGAGTRNTGGFFDTFGGTCAFWTSEGYSYNEKRYGYRRGLGIESSEFSDYSGTLANIGHSVRCLMDEQ
ncbi:fibrobacter succinogenes major paralogous domain-containing protein, partial [bacterium]|nr:fibrobacter succinogenes major paralogous domain-containing protein [bacterium]